MYTGKIDIETKHANDLLLLCDHLNLKIVCQTIRQQIDLIDENYRPNDRCHGYLAPNDTYVMPITSVEPHDNTDIPISVIDIKKEWTDSIYERLDISEQSESHQLPVQVDNIKHETAHNKKEMFSIGDTTSENSSSGGNVKLPENLNCHTVDDDGLALKTGLSNGTHGSVYPIAAYKTPKSGQWLQLFSQSDTFIRF